MVTEMKHRRMPLEELALAYELRQEGCCWGRIALGLGCSAAYLEQAVRDLTRGGIHSHRRTRNEPQKQ